MSQPTNLEMLLLEAKTTLEELKLYSSIEPSKNTTTTIYSWMDDNGEWWSSLSQVPPTLPPHFQTKVIMEKNMWNIQHRNYQEVSQFQKAVRSA